VAASAADLNIAGVSQYSSSKEQVTSITQFSDVKPTDWAYQALSNLIERYGCVAGYPNGTYKGGQAMTRYEAAALLNACLDRITEVTDELKRLMKEFEKELAVLKGRVDGLEAKVGELEATQFSTTTKLKGIATFTIGANSYGGDSKDFGDFNPARGSFILDEGEIVGFSRDIGSGNARSLAFLVGDRAESKYGLPNDKQDLADFTSGYQGATAFNYDVRLNFDTSFTGKDLLRTTLRAGNFASGPWGTGPVGLNALEVGFEESCGEADCGDVVAVNRLFYQFPVGNGFTATFGGRVRQDDMLAMWPSVYPADTVLDVFTYAGAPGAYSLALGAGAGIWYQKNGWNISLNYVAANGDVGNAGNGDSEGENDACDNGGGGIGTDCSAETFTAQVGYAGSNWGAAVAYQYLNGYGQFPGGSVTSAFTPFALEALASAQSTNSVALSAYWQPSTNGWVPSISAGWGITSASFTDHTSFGEDNIFDSATIQSWYVGLQWADAFVKGNTLGMGVGQAPFVTGASFKDVGDFDGDSFTPQDGNYVWEWWYKFQVTDNISVTPAIFYLSNPLGQAGYSYQNATDGDLGAAALTNFGAVVKTTFKF
jgi:hypothetical protein